ncbi:hypothetical protein [Yinghuangia soli]|uniref:Uncharacterized protein n=1 Tax=Yinghuangia soli TaxID=2908204 RepID=A0AA41U2K4_9ACTN|nr:hypothetical protein [Yinghuangia soli]MCF2530791.1 hypothetical protein [Yinghuangia soli]
MSNLTGVQHATIDAIVANAGRATLPFRRAHRDEQYATAFWFNELVETTAEVERVRQFLVTAGEPTRVEIAEFTLRPELCAPAVSAEKLIWTGFADGWTHLGDLGVAVLPTSGLHEHGERKGWQWTTDEITDGMAAKDDDIAALGAEPVPAYLLGHDVGAGNGAREQAVVVGAVARARRGGVVWVGDVPQGCVGAPVFIGVSLGGDSFKLVCVGAVLPGRGGRHPIATFDRIRTALSRLAPDAASAVEAAGQTPPTPEKKKRWWQRHG